jgi:23S rRNA pseudouridine1911/1915/1917 synthase
MILFDSEQHEPMEWVVEETNAETRLDKYLTESSSEDISRSQIQIWIKDGHVMVNGQAVKANYRLSAGDRIELTMPEASDVEIVPEAIPLEIAYEDHDVIVVNKARGMVVHPAPGHSSGTLVNALMHHCTDLSGINGERRPGIVHRIDKDTSGLIMAAKHDKSHLSLSAQLKAHSVTRRYIAIVHGRLEHDQGTVDAPIGRDPKDRKLFAVNTVNGKHAVTHFKVLERFPDYTILELQLETGRTHQIRVHMKFIGHPLVGDPVYGRTKGVAMQGQALHAAVLGFKHPLTGEDLEFEAPVPVDMLKVVEIIKSL